jgi:hypothetical protein
MRFRAARVTSVPLGLALTAVSLVMLAATPQASAQSIVSAQKPSSAQESTGRPVRGAPAADILRPGNGSLRTSLSPFTELFGGHTRHPGPQGGGVQAGPPTRTTGRAGTAFVPCGPNAGANLQAAVHSPADTLVLSPVCTYSIRTPDPLSVATGDPAALYINRTLKIIGNAATIRRDTQRATSDFRVIRIEAPGNLTLTDLTVRDGRTPQSEVTGFGGGILLDGPNTVLTTYRVSITHNRAGVFGGGVANGAGTATFNSSRITGNTATSAGGVLSSGAVDTFNSSTISNNTAGAGAGLGADTSRIEFNNSSVTNNRSSNTTGGSAGGGMELFRGVVATLNRTRVARNTVTARDFAGGGGIYMVEATLNLNSSPLTGNTVISGIDSAQGGGLFIDVAGGTATLRFSPVTFNRATGGLGTRGGGIYNSLPNPSGAVSRFLSPVAFNIPDQCFNVSGC